MVLALYKEFLTKSDFNFVNNYDCKGKIVDFNNNIYRTFSLAQIFVYTMHVRPVPASFTCHTVLTFDGTVCIVITCIDVLFTEGIVLCLYF